MIPKVVVAVGIGVLPGADPVHAACCCYLEIHFVTGVCFLALRVGLRAGERTWGGRLETVDRAWRQAYFFASEPTFPSFLPLLPGLGQSEEGLAG